MVRFETAFKQKNREATTPRFSFRLLKAVQSDFPADAGFALDTGLALVAALSLKADFSLEAGVLVSEAAALFSALGFEVSLDEALPLVPLVALVVSVGGVLFFA